MITNLEMTFNVEEEFAMMESMMYTLQALQLISPYKLNMEQVDNSDGTVTLRLNNFELTNEMLNNIGDNLEMLGKIGL